LVICLKKSPAAETTGKIELADNEKSKKLLKLQEQKRKIEEQIRIEEDRIRLKLGRMTSSMKK